MILSGCTRPAPAMLTASPAKPPPLRLLLLCSFQYLYMQIRGETCPLHFKTAVRKVQGDFCVDHHSSVSGKVLGGLLWMAASPAIVVCHCHTRHSISMSPLFTHHGQDHAEGCSCQKQQLDTRGHHLQQRQEVPGIFGQPLSPVPSMSTLTCPKEIKFTKFGERRPL